MAFYIVKNTGFANNGFAYGEEKGKINTGNAIKCEECGSFLTMLEWLPPYEVKLSKGRLGDVVFGTYSHFLVSEKFKELYYNNRFTGILKFEPVRMYQKGRHIMEKYYYPKIVLSNVHVDIEKSGIVFAGTEECSTCQKAGRVIQQIKGLYFSDEANVEYDVFCTKILPADILFSKRLKNATKDFLNLSVTEAETYVPSWII